jgi:hypothetical protein
VGLLENLLFAAAVFVVCSVMALTLLLLIELARTIVP